MPYSVRYTLSGAQAGGPGAPNNCSCHHIIARPMMYALGALSMAYIFHNWDDEAVLRGKLVRICDPHNLGNAMAETALEEVGIQVNVGIHTEAAATQNILPHIAWKPGNLFVGPNATMRMDDPSQNNDGIPMSFPEDRAAALNTLIKQIANSGNLNIARRDGDSVTIRIENHLLAALARCFIETIGNYGDKAVYHSLVSDWIIKSGSANYRIFIPAALGTQPEGSQGDLKLKLKGDTLNDEQVFKVNRFHAGFYRGSLVNREGPHNTQQGEQLERHVSRL